MYMMFARKRRERERLLGLNSRDILGWLPGALKFIAQGCTPLNINLKLDCEDRWILGKLTLIIDLNSS